MLILASQSQSRKAMLEAAGVAFEARPAAIDERALEQGLRNLPPEEIARTLAREKALAIATPDQPRWVLGSDSLIVVNGRRFDKPASRENAAEHLRAFSGQDMYLYSAAAVAREGHVKFDCCDCAILHVRTLSDEFITQYLEAEWPAVAGCVGVFRIEGRGVQLFESIEGDHFTVLGMPLFKVLGALRQFTGLAE